MRKALFVLVALLVCAMAASAAPAKAATSNKTALMFSFDGLGTLGVSPYASENRISYTTLNTILTGHDADVNLDEVSTGFYGPGVKFPLSPKLALEASALFGMDNVTMETGDPDLDPTKTQFLGYGALAGIDYYLLKTDALSVYLGGQLGYKKWSLENTRMYKKTVSTVTTIYKKVATVGGSIFGVGATCGFEYFIFKDISLGGRYVLGYDMGSSTCSISTAVGAASATSVNYFFPDTATASSSTLALTLSVYF